MIDGLQVAAGLQMPDLHFASFRIKRHEASGQARIFALEREVGGYVALCPSAAPFRQVLWDSAVLILNGLSASGGCFGETILTLKPQLCVQVVVTIE